MTKRGTLLGVNDQNSVTIRHANETRSGHNYFVGDFDENTNLQICKQLQAFLHRLSENTKTVLNYIIIVNKKIKINFCLKN